MIKMSEYMAICLYKSVNVCKLKVRNVLFIVTDIILNEYDIVIYSSIIAGKTSLQHTISEVFQCMCHI